MKCVVIVAVLALLFCSVFAHGDHEHEHKSCNNNSDCNESQFCGNKKVCLDKFNGFCQNTLACQLAYGKNTRCVLEENENYGKCLKNYQPMGDCYSNSECSSKDYCTGDKKTNKKGKCIKRPENFCQNLNHCKVGDFCEKQTGNLGICKPMDLSKNPKRSIHPVKEIFIPHMSPQEYAAAPMGIGEKVGSKCGMEDFDDNIAHDTASCSQSYSCDNPATRNTYNNAGSQKVYKIVWMYFKCGSGWEANAAKRISEAMADLNTYYKDIGYQFNAYYSEYTCQGSGNTNMDNFDSTMAAQAIVREKGNNFKGSGNMHIVVGTPSDNLINGWFWFPGGSYSGTGFMNTRVVAKGYSTLAHEIGHGFGLHHTFRGISELTSCSDGCKEVTASDLTGDYCQDTPPIVKNWDCVSPLTATDPCNTKSSWNPNPYQNIMSYGDCRSQFTANQKARVRCFQDKYLNFLVEDTNPVQNPGSSTLPTAPVQSKIDPCSFWNFPFPCPFGASTTATYSLFGIIVLLVFTLLN